MTDPAALTDEELAEIEARANAAAPGPWTTGDHPSDECRIEGPHHPGDSWWFTIYDEGGHDADDARFIAAARTDVPRLIAALRAERDEVAVHRSRAERSLELRRENGRLQAEVERLQQDARDNYARAEQAEQALMPLRAQAERLRAVADDLAIALHQCAAFLPPLLNGEEGRKKLDRALDVNNQVDAALSAYCVVTETRRQALNNRTVKG